MPDLQFAGAGRFYIIIDVVGEMVMKCSLIAFDLDGTLLNGDGHLSEVNRSALMNAMDKGIHVCICTGRAYNTIPEELLGFPGLNMRLPIMGHRFIGLRTGANSMGCILIVPLLKRLLRLHQIWVWLMRHLLMERLMLEESI